MVNEILMKHAANYLMQTFWFSFRMIRTSPNILLIIASVSLHLGTIHAAEMNRRDTLAPYPFHVDLWVFDLPFQQQAAKQNSVFENFSMAQSLSITQNIHRTNYYFTNKLWRKILPESSKKNLILNRIFANLNAGIVDYLFTYYVVALSPQWLHEEFHRSGLTIRNIGSYNETYNGLKGETPYGSVSDVKDEDLIALKKYHPQELVRSFAAGIESELLLIKGLQKDNFFLETKYPNVALQILLTKHAMDYVNQFKNDDYDASIDSMNFHGQHIPSRDFVGWDFTPWVYDLHRPDEPYENRGTHPSGQGIDRAIKTSQLTQQELDYLHQVGKLQYLNFISPFMLGIQRFRLNEDFQFNFALRHFLTSFGYSINADFFVKYKNLPLEVSLLIYKNQKHWSPGISIERHKLSLPVNASKILTLQPKAMLWLQPKDFYDGRPTLGGLFSLQASYPLLKTISILSAIEAKTKGWVAGNPYLANHLNFRMGISSSFHIP